MLKPCGLFPPDPQTKGRAVKEETRESERLLWSLTFGNTPRPSQSHLLGCAATLASFSHPQHFPPWHLLGMTQRIKVGFSACSNSNDSLASAPIDSCTPCVFRKCMKSSEVLLVFQILQPNKRAMDIWKDHIFTFFQSPRNLVNTDNSCLTGQGPLSPKPTICGGTLFSFVASAENISLSTGRSHRSAIPVLFCCSQIQAGWVSVLRVASVAQPSQLQPLPHLCLDPGRGSPWTAVLPSTFKQHIRNC